MTRSSRRFLLLSALTSAAMVTSFSASAKNEGPELYFYPAGGWKLEKAAKTCTVSSQFNNGFLMQFAGAEDKWVQSLSINFRQDIFKSGQDYSVKLTVPGAKTQSFTGKSLNAQSLSMDLQNHKDFYKALSKSSVLDVTIEENSFRFYLTGFSGFTDGFERCMSGSSVEAALNPPPPDIAVQNTQKSDKNKKPEDFTVNEAIAMEEGVKKATAEPIPVAPAPDEAAKAVKEAEEALAEASKPTPAALGSEPKKAEPVKEAKPVEKKPEPGKALEKKAEAPVAIAEAEIDEAQVEAEAQADEPLIEEAIDAPMPAAKPETPAPAPVLKSEPKAEVAQAPTPAAAQPAMISSAPGLINKNSMSPESIAAMIEAQNNPNAAKAAAPAADNAPIPAAPASEAMAEAETKSTLPSPKMAMAAPAEEMPIFIDDGATGTENLLPLEGEERPDLTAGVPPMPAEPAAEVEDAMPIAAPDTRMSSPQMKVNRETIIANADIRALDAQAPAAGNMTNQVMIDKINDLESMVEKLKAENIALNDEVRASVDASKEEKLNITSDNWNLEQATIRFNESERQVKRLGQELQMERARCSGEKKDLEAMLFDPQVTDQQQLARLSQLEGELAAAKAEIEDQRARYEAQIKLLQGHNIAR